ncbi:MAG: acyl carrier protein, partial [Gammaproteobacteria bacterium]|nr:acyl carrier protein [Gammaproteobacteria bacterium]
LRNLATYPRWRKGWRKGRGEMTDYQEYLDFLYSALATQNKKNIELTESTHLVADIGLSSLEVMEFIEKIEDHFDISIPLNILPDVNTIGELANKVRELNP